MAVVDDAELFGNAEDQRAYEDFCANQEAVEKFTLDKPALVCRWRMSNKKVPMLNRHIRALSERLVRGEPIPLVEHKPASRTQVPQVAAKEERRVLNVRKRRFEGQGRVLGKASSA